MREANRQGDSKSKGYSSKDKILDAIYFFKQLRLLRSVVRNQKPSMTNIRHLPENVQESLTLSSLFNLHGSDKSTHHDYHLVYGGVLGHRRYGLKKIVEVGIGSNDLETPQNMGSEGHPGASLRAFRDWAPNAEVIGADIDSKTLFTEPRITTCLVNQLSPESFLSLNERVGTGADLIVIDGLHTPRADINSLLQLLPRLSPSGCFVIEDISPRAALLLWPFVKLVMRKRYFVTLRGMKNGYLLVVLSGK